MNFLYVLSNIAKRAQFSCERDICTPPRPSFYELNLVFASASWNWSRRTATANNMCSDSTRSCNLMQTTEIFVKCSHLNFPPFLCPHNYSALFVGRTSTFIICRPTKLLLWFAYLRA